MVVYNSEYGGQKQGGGGLASLEHYFTIHTMYNIYICTKGGWGRIIIHVPILCTYLLRFR